MHVGTVHREHYVEMAHDDQFLIHGFTIARDIGALTILVPPEIEIFIFLLTPSEEEDAGTWVISGSADEVLLRSDLLGQQV